MLMNAFTRLSRIVAWKSITFLVFCILLLAQVLLGVIHAHAANNSLVGLSLHSYDLKGNQTNYIEIMYSTGGINCVNIPSHSWYDLPVSNFMPAGQTVQIRYFSDPSCSNASEFLQAAPHVPANPVYGKCWFNPDNTTTPNWSGCVKPSQTVPITFGSSSTQVGLTLHSYDLKGNQTNYIKVKYNTSEVSCVNIPSGSWYDLPISNFISAGQTIWIYYFSDSSCSNELLQASPSIPANPPFNHCWFNPGNTTTPNWSGCVKPSQTVPVTFGSPGTKGLLGLSLHSDNSIHQTNYVTVTYKGADGNKRNHVWCASVPSGSWYNVPVSNFAEAGQTIWIRYYSSQKCNPSSKFLEAYPQIPQNPPYNHCWFNPSNTTTPNWSGCVKPSQIVPLTKTR